ncbi:MAG: hypothetical protein A3I44_04970 [Candidatus Sungbacteria bacterium RIFCSPLOWO2_02_FULL_51_17]|uniref:Prepilin type IV endopeptidase peptidase domain-containing protein n=1 Tax=Candidatus Sungbacteria bacterium RIFCSPHIGHO2_02_FULL_51_29 TaxID=1802273 RepID=A0A1G2KUZ5_9BACT|nr:MAG: hypothetical protein A2676_03770 [Candidatus Sungbacteria bacterium RIFCSPHIGHO2_01_FULL_51_22]OHA02452.1 MAG: hypothetical protein A3C16_04955 [Candidatus Sungbacteria bacterium RIFCSPHIGHO2_02_FULL_51_29]OHA05560.1 MAG: hypothetical protein A3B29_02700 [Candidatus Sungbacteria bacterium RIFCSPLOWO2_01_FULL_51_34]OHA11692.1 MAG: hypothetical protein A3I44_04970 [Candidatus Sungbacteria bacterium RIFCSPLOWO2_02_FULL_51_17]
MLIDYLYVSEFVSLLYYFAFAVFLIVIFAYDVKHMIIPDFATAGIAALACIGWAVRFFSGSASTSDIGMTAGVAMLALIVFGGIWGISRGNAMGFGDVKLAPVLVLFLGGLKGGIAILLSFWVGALVGIMVVIIKRGTLKSKIPFGPYLAFGAFVSLVWGDGLANTYFRLLGV